MDQIVAAVGIVWNCQTYQFGSVRVVAREFAAIRVKSTFWFRSLGPASGKGARGNICGGSNLINCWRRDRDFRSMVGHPRLGLRTRKSASVESLVPLQTVASGSGVE